MKKIIVVYACILMLASCQDNSEDSKKSEPAGISDSSAKPAVLDSGWVYLFDGKSLQNWHTYGKKEAGQAWNIDSGSIHLKAGAKNGYQTIGGGDLLSNDSFGNFDLKLEWKIQKKDNSGVMFYVQEDTAKYKETWNTGPEMQVCDPDSNEDSHSYKHEAGDLYDLIASTKMSARPAMEWNEVEILSNHEHLDLFLNGVHIISTGLWDRKWEKLISESKFKSMPGFGTFHSGYFALQDHGEEVWYRNIRIRKL